MVTASASRRNEASVSLPRSMRFPCSNVTTARPFLTCRLSPLRSVVCGNGTCPSIVAFLLPIKAPTGIEPPIPTVTVNSRDTKINSAVSKRFLFILHRLHLPSGISILGYENQSGNPDPRNAVLVDPAARAAPYTESSQPKRSSRSTCEFYNIGSAKGKRERHSIALALKFDRPVRYACS